MTGQTLDMQCYRRLYTGFLLLIDLITRRQSLINIQEDKAIENQELEWGGATVGSQLWHKQLLAGKSGSIVPLVFWVTVSTI
jgi:hypothetical protein